MVSDRYILELIRKSVGYKTTVGPVDKSKVDKALAGFPSQKPSSALGEAAWQLAKRVAQTNPPPPPPPPTYKKVAPRVAYKQDGSDARYCCVNQPGVTLRPDGTYRDDVAEYDDRGFCLGRERSDGSAADGIVGAREIDGRPLCSLPTPGDPTKNTGSWQL
jgi:hypothetical protein